MKYVRFIILFIVFIGMIVFITRSGAKKNNEQNKVLSNGVILEGTVSDIKRSNNHGFGILTINVLHSSVEEFSKKLDHGIYPYQIKGKTAEVYLPIFIERQIGDHVKLISDKQTVYYKGDNSEDKGEVYIVTDTSDLNFVKENTLFNKK